MKKSYLFLLFAICSFTVQAQTWELVYHNDLDGNPVSGSQEDLIQAVRDGQDIRLAWWSQSSKDPKRKVEHLADAKFLTIMSDIVVFAQIDPIYGQTPDFEEQKITLKENLQWVMIAGTNGKFESMMTDIITGEIKGHGIRQLPFKWYVKK